MRRHLSASLVVFALFAAGCSSSSSDKAAPATTPPTTRGAAPAPAPAAANPVGHVFVINLENKNYDSTWGSGSVAKYLNATLVPMGVLLTNYYGIGHASLDNYIAQ